MKSLRFGAMVLALPFGLALLLAQSTVTLSPAASPGTGEPGVTNIIVTGYGFPSGSIPPANVTVTLQPSKAGAGPSGTTQANAVQPLFGGTQRVTFTVPVSIAVVRPTSYLVSLSGSTSTGAVFSSGNNASLSITPAAQVSIFPTSGAGGTVQVTITGYYTSFLQGSTEANFGPGISVGGAPPGEWGPVTVVNNSDSSATAQLVIGIPAVLGKRTVTIATGTEEASPASGFTINAQYSTLYNFTGGASSGSNPKRALVFGSDDVLYGTAVAGGSSGDGIAFSYTLCSSCSPFAILHTFTGFPGDGSAPDGSFAIGSTGTMYGATGSGGSQPPAGDGTVFSMTPPVVSGGAWTETVLYSFAGSPNDGADPYAGVVIGNGGVLYGTTFYGGTGNNGVVFQLVPPASPGGVWTETILHKFAGSPGDGANPHTAVTPGSGGVLYGTTYNGGASGHGTVYQLTPPASPGGAWAETVIHDFAGSPNDGANPHGNLLPGADGVLYGTALSGGEFGQGMVFSLTPPASPGGAWTETVLYSFAGGTDAAEPRAALVMELDGSLYSTTYEGGTSGVGTVFSVSPPASPGGAWTETVWHSFSGADGANPEAGLVMDSNGVLYGATFYGGTSNLGVLFSLDP